MLIYNETLYEFLNLLWKSLKPLDGVACSFLVTLNKIVGSWDFKFGKSLSELDKMEWWSRLLFSFKFELEKLLELPLVSDPFDG